MPKRSRKGVVIRPDLVVAPTSVNLGRSMRTERAAGALADNQIELKIFHSWIKDFLDRWAEAMNFVNKQNIACFQVRQNCSKVTRLGNHRPRCRPKTNAHFFCDNGCQGCFTQSGWPVKQHMVQGFTTTDGCRNEDLQVSPALAAGQRNHQVFVGEVQRPEYPRKSVQLRRCDHLQPSNLGLPYGYRTVLVL